MAITIEETTVATVGGWTVTCGNIMRDRFTPEGGAEQEGLTAELGLYDGDGKAHGEPTVGVGSVVLIDGVPHRVDAVVAGRDDGHGHVALVPVR